MQQDVVAGPGSCYISLRCAVMTQEGNPQDSRSQGVRLALEKPTEKVEKPLTCPIRVTWHTTDHCDGGRRLLQSVRRSPRQPRYFGPATWNADVIHGGAELREGDDATESAVNSARAENTEILCIMGNGAVHSACKAGMMERMRLVHTVARNWVLTLALLGSAITGPPHAGATQPPAKSPRIALQGEVDLARLVDLCAQRLDLTIEYDASVLKGKATLRLTDTLTDEQLWELTNRILSLRGFTTVKLHGDDGQQILSVVRLADAAGLAEVTADEARGASLAGFVAVVVRVEHQPIKDTSEALKSILSKSGSSVTTLGNSNLLLIADLGPRVEQALQLFRQIDQPGPESIIQRLELTHVSASHLAAMLASITAARDLVDGRTSKGRVVAEPGDRAVILIAPPDEADGWRSLVQRFDQVPPVETRTYSPRYFGLDEVATLIEQAVHPTGSGEDQWRLVRDQLTGSIILTASPLAHEQVQSIIDRLNSMPAESRRPMRTYQVRNRSVTEVVDVLERLMNSGVLEEAAGTGARTAPSSPPNPEPSGPSPRLVPGSPVIQSPSPSTDPPLSSPDSRRSGATAAGDGPNPSSLTLTADEMTSTIIATGEPRLLDQVEQLIRQLDVRQPQVMVEILIVSLSESQTIDLGVELEKIEVSGDVRLTLSSLFGLSSFTNGLRSVGNGQGGSALVLSPGDFSVVVRALETINDGRSLNVPRVLVNNNQEAMLNSVLQQPFVSINAFNTIATTSFGGTQDAGTVITVKPQIAQGDHMIIDYSVTLSAFVGEPTDPSLPPPRQENSLQSVATIPDGYVVALGGIEVTSESKGVSQVPGLAEIPIVGELFKNRSRSQSRNRFYVFIRPSILRRLDFEDLRYLSEAPLEAGAIDDGWPTVEPRVIR